MADPARPPLALPVPGDAAGSPATDAHHYRAALAGAPAILFALCLRTGAMRWVSENVQRLSGRPPSDFVGEREQWLAFVHADDRARLEAAVRDVRAARRWDVEFRLRHASGVYRWFRSTGVLPPGTPGEVHGVALVYEEQHRLSARERTYAELMLALNRSLVSDDVLVHVVETARRLLDSERAMVWVPDPDEQTLRNVAQSGSLVVPIIEVPVHDPDALVARCFRTGMPECVADYDTIAGDYPARLRPNDAGPVLCVPVLVGGRPAAVLGIARTHGRAPFSALDREDAAHLATQAGIALANARLYQTAHAANEAKTSFLSTLSHELRTPLGTLDGFIELLALELAGPLTDRQRDYVARLQRASAHVLRIVEDLFDLTRIEHGRARVRLAPFDVRDTLRDAAELVRPRADRAGLRLHAELPAHEVLAYADADRVRQILVNLMANAVKFTGRGEIVVGVTVAGARTRVCVRDTGPGIPAALHEKVFEPFYQLGVKGGAGDDGAGAGLGLAVSRSLARLMAGDLTLESEVGGGCAFTLELPSPPADVGLPAATSFPG
jgi:signal transduction histidine kinase